MFIMNRLKAVSAVSIFLFLVACSSSDSGNGGSPNPPADSAFSTFDEASVVIGQVDFSTQTQQLASVNSVSGGTGPIAYFVETGDSSSDVEKQLILPIAGQNRSLVFDGVPESNLAAAETVLGQAGFLGQLSAVGINTMDTPVGAAANAQIVLISDSENHRVLGYEGFPLSAFSSAVDADKVIGQNAFDEKFTGCSANQFNTPSGVTITPSGKLFVADTGHHRVLLFNTIPSAVQGLIDADLAIGVGSFTNCNASSAQLGLKRPTGVWSDDDILIVADTGNNRVLIWNELPTVAGALPDVVLGQMNFTQVAANDVNGDGLTDFPKAVSASTLSLTSNVNTSYTGVDVSSDGQLCITDTDNNRVLLWDSIPSKNGEAADVVLGQSDFTRWVQWDDDQDGVVGFPSSRTLYNPMACKFIDDKLVVADYGTNRYLVFEQQ